MSTVAAADVRGPLRYSAVGIVDVGDGTSVGFPASMVEGVELTVARSAQRDLGSDRLALTDPYELVLSGGLPAEGVVVEFAVPEAMWGDDDPSDEVGVVTLNEASGVWTPVPVEFDARRRVMRVVATHFSWWAPWTWDWAGIGARIDQNIGQLVGKRAGEPVCGRGQPTPGWVSSIAGASMDAALVVRSCAEGEGDVLAVELVNNRPYGLTLTYGSDVEWGWHEEGGSAADRARNAIAEAAMRPDQLYLPPLSRASVGIVATDPGAHVTYRVSVTAASVLGDVVAAVASDVLPSLTGSFNPLNLIGECAAFLGGAEPMLQPAAILDTAKGSADCAMAALENKANGTLVSELAKLHSSFAALKKATLVGRLLTIYDYEWKLLDLYIDNAYAAGPELGFGFSVLARATSSPSETPPQADCLDTDTALALASGYIEEVESVDVFDCYPDRLAIGSAWLTGADGMTVAWSFTDGEWTFLSASFGLRSVCESVWAIDVTIDIGCGTNFDWPYGTYFDVPQLGVDPVRGSGCGASGGLGDTLPDGIWNGYIHNIGPDSLEFDVMCVFYGESALPFIQKFVGENGYEPAFPDFFTVNNSTNVRTVPLAPGFLHRDAVWEGERGCVDPGASADFDASQTLHDVIDSWLVVEGGIGVFALTSCPYG